LNAHNLRGEQIAKVLACSRMDEGRKRVLLIAAAILAARKLAQFPSTPRVPATISAISDVIRFAHQIMVEIDRLGPSK
jgi:hypothetical protein